MPQIGKVYLVGAGPGDPGLLTLRGRELLSQADVVVYDTLVHPEILRHAAKAELIFVGKKSGQHSLPQEEINRILIEQAQRVGCVVRLKGGDPFVFGRGGEEALVLMEAGISFEVVPGVTAGVAVPALAGIPVTHRGMSSSVTFLTAHLNDDGTLPDPDTLIKQGTLVLYMGVKSLPQMCQALIANGRAPETPVAAIEWGTCARQRCISGTLETIVALCDHGKIEAPALVIIGEVCKLRKQLQCIETCPLHGLRVVVTHAVERQGLLEMRLRELGAEVFSLPMLSIAATVTNAALWNFIEIDWIILTSINATKTLFEELERQGLDARALAGVKLCAVGASTRDAVEARYLKVDATPVKHTSESVLSALGNVQGSRILIPRSEIARRTLPEALRKAGAQVTETVAYTHQTPQVSKEDLETLRRFDAGLLIFTNAAAVENFAAVSPDDLKDVPVASIGPVTSTAARQSGFTVAVEPIQHNIADLLEAVCAWYGKRGGG